MKTKRNTLVLVAALFAANLNAAPADPGRTDAGADFHASMAPQVTVNRYYTGNDGYFYSSRIRRFHRPMITAHVGYYDPIFTDMYWYGTEFSTGSSLYWGLPYWYYSPNYVQVVYNTPIFYWNDYYDPYLGGGFHVSLHIGYPRYYTPFREVYYVGYGGIFGTRMFYRGPVHYHYINYRPAVYQTWYNARPVYYSSNSFVRNTNSYRSRSSYHTRDYGYARTTAPRRTSVEAVRSGRTSTGDYRNREAIRNATGREGNRTTTQPNPRDTHRPVLNPADVRRGGTKTTPTNPDRVTPSVTRRTGETNRTDGRTAVTPPRDTRTPVTTRPANNRANPPANSRANEVRRNDNRSNNRAVTPPRQENRSSTVRSNSRNERSSSRENKATAKSKTNKNEGRSSRSERSSSRGKSSEKSSGKKR